MPTFRHALFLVLVLSAGCASLALAQSSMPKIGLLSWSDSECDWQAFFRGLEEFGYKRDQTIAIECQTAGGHTSGLAVAARALVGLSVDIIVSTSQPGGRAAHAATKTIPIVTIISGDPVADGLARSLGKPGGNLTGVSYYATELTAKRLELLKEAIPKITKVGVLANPDVSYLPFEADTKRAASELGLAAIIHQVREESDLESAFSKMKSEGAQAVFILPDMMLANAAVPLGALTVEYHLPTMAWGGWFTERGCLMTYSADYDEMDHRLAYYVDRILKGTKPGDLPIEQPTTFKLSINLKTAKALGIAVPGSMLLLADRVIE
jgi:putative ABC transport system substrate-binding protein